MYICFRYQYADRYNKGAFYDTSGWIATASSQIYSRCMLRILDTWY